MVLGLIKFIIKYSLLVLILFVGRAHAQQYTEYDLKAAYLYNFSKFVSWPENAFETENSNFEITVIGDSPITDVLFKAFKGRKIEGRRITISVVYTVEDLETSHLLFVSKDMESELSSILTKLSNAPTLLVGDVIEGFCRSGGIINFTKKSSKYRFEINNQSAIKSNIKISSKLLSLARIISSEEIKF